MLLTLLDLGENSFLTQVSNFSGCTLSGGDMMIDPDIEACHELRCTYCGKFNIFADLLFFLFAGAGGKQRAAGPTSRP